MAANKRAVTNFHTNTQKGFYLMQSMATPLFICFLLPPPIHEARRIDAEPAYYIPIITYMKSDTVVN